MKYYTYVYIDPRDNLPFYIGKGKFRRAYDKKNKAVQDRINKLKKIGLEHILNKIYVNNEAEAFELETLMIEEIGRKDLGTGTLFNFTNGGEGSSGAVRSPAFRAKISAAQKGIPKPPFTLDHCIKLSNAKKGVPKPPRTLEHCSNISVATKGKKRKPLTLEHKAKLSAAMMGNQYASKRA